PGEGPDRSHHGRAHHGDQARSERAHGHREQPEPGRDHLGDAEQQGGDEPHLPFVHGGEVSAPRAGAPRGGPSGSGRLTSPPPTPRVFPYGTAPHRAPLPSVRPSRRHTPRRRPQPRPPPPPLPPPV